MLFKSKYRLVLIYCLLLASQNVYGNIAFIDNYVIKFMYNTEDLYDMLRPVLSLEESRLSHTLSIYSMKQISISGFGPATSSLKVVLSSGCHTP